MPMPYGTPLSVNDVDHGLEGVGRDSKRWANPRLFGYLRSQGKRSVLSNNIPYMNMYQLLKKGISQPSRNAMMCKIFNFLHPECWSKKPKNQTWRNQHRLWRNVIRL